MSVSTHYQGDAGSLYARHYQTDPYLLGYKINFEYFKPHLRVTDRALDFGCGNGGMLRLLSQSVRQAEGLEVNPQAASIARGLGLRVYQSMDELPAGSVYDAIISNHVLEHVRDAAGTLERLRGSMKAGGRLLLKLPLDDWRAREQRRWTAEDINHHLQTWTPLSLGNVLTEAGYEVGGVRVITSAWDPRLFPLAKVGLRGLAFWLLAVVKKRRELFVTATPRLT